MRSRRPVWLALLSTPILRLRRNDHMPRLITGAQSMQTRTYTADADKIAALAKDSGAERAWLNSQTAANFGIADGDEVELFHFHGQDSREGPRDEPHQSRSGVRAASLWH